MWVYGTEIHKGNVEMAKIKLVEKDKNPNRVTFKERMRYSGWTMVYCVTAFLWIFFMFFMEDEWILESLLSEANSPMMILESYQKWKTVMTTFYAVSAAGSIVWCMFCYWQQRRVQKTRKWKRDADKIQAFEYKRRINPRWAAGEKAKELIPPDKVLRVAVCIVPLIAAAMLTSMLLEYGKGLQEDILAIREGKLREEVLCVYPKGKVTGLAGSYTDCVVCYETTGLEIYVPQYMEFVPDRHEKYNPNNDRTWLAKHSATYKVTYTPNYRLVTSIELVKPAE